MSPPLRLDRVWDRLSIYLPLLLMLALALGTYWLVRSAPATETLSEAAPPRHEPDYFLKELSIKTFDPQGTLREEITGAEARHFPDTLTFEMDRPDIRTVNNQGRVTLITAQKSLSNEDHSEIQLLGNASILRKAGTTPDGKKQEQMQLQGEFLHFFKDTERVKSHKPVVITRGNDKFTANSLDLDNLDRTISLQGRVRGSIFPNSKPPAASTKP